MQAVSVVNMPATKLSDKQTHEPGQQLSRPLHISAAGRRSKRASGGLRSRHPS